MCTSGWCKKLLQYYSIALCNNNQFLYLGVEQDNPLLVRVAFVTSTCSQKEEFFQEKELEECLKEVRNKKGGDSITHAKGC